MISAMVIALLIAIEDTKSRIISNKLLVLLAGTAGALHAFRALGLLPQAAPISWHCGLLAPSARLMSAAPRLKSCVISALLVMASLIVLELIWQRVFHSSGIGMGDIKYLGVQALFIGADVWFVLAVASILGALYALLCHKRDFAFGPWLSLGFVIWLVVLCALVI